VPTAPVPKTPVTFVTDVPVTATVPTAPVALTPVKLTTVDPVAATVPTCPVADTPVTLTAILTLVEPRSENGAAENGKKPNI
jgi:hypothetical protein